MSDDNYSASLFTKEEWQQLATALHLAPRQQQILQCLFAGLSDKQIALQLDITVPTVRTHLSRLFVKFDVEDRTELILHVFWRFRNDCH